MINRYLPAVGTGLLMTLSLLFVMQLLIRMQPGVIVDNPPRLPVFLVPRQVIDNPPPPVATLPDRQQLTDTQVPPAPLSQMYGSIPVRGPTATAGAVSSTFDTTTIRMVDGPLVALLRVEPQYPARPLSRSLEGYVLVEFDVLADGSVANVSVVESSDRLFEKAAIRAAERFRFKPRVVDGVPLATTGIRNLFRFEIPD